MDTRFTMFFSFVLWCLFGSSVQIAKILPEDRDSLVYIALNMQNVDTGYPDEPYAEIDIKKSDIDSLRKIIEAKVDRLYCRYMFSVVSHMVSTRTLFNHRMGDEQIKRIALFKDVVPDMIGTLYGLGDQDFDGLWLFNVYVNELPKYFKSVTAGKWPISVELADKLSNVHQMVTRYLKYAAFTRPCTDQKKLKTTSSQLKSADCFDNLKSLNNLMLNNRKYGVVADNSNNSFTPAQLYLNDFVVEEQLMAGLQLLVSDLKIDCSAFYARLTELNSEAHDFLLLGHGTRSIDSYHDLLFDFVELVVLRFARKHVLLTISDLNDGLALTNKFTRRAVANNQLDLTGKYKVGNATMSKQTAAMTRLFRIDNEWLNKCISMFWKTVALNNLNAIEVAGRQEEERIINKHNGSINATQIQLNYSVGLDIFQSVLKLASSHGITITHDTPGLENNAISSVRMNIITMDITRKYFANVLFKGVKFGVLDLFRNRNKNYI